MPSISRPAASVNIRPAESLYSAYMTRRMLLFDPQHPVPDSDMGLDIPGGAGTLLQLFPQRRHKNPEGSHVIFPFAAPHALGNVFMSQNLSCVLRQQA